MTARPRILYVMCPGHSGSTLLDLLLSRHSRIGTVGELKTLSTKPEVRCLCGVTPFSSCGFWREVEARMKATSGLAFADLDLLSADPARFTAHNAAVYAACAEVTGRSVLVDSSKSRPRLEGLLASSAFDVTPIHLVRDPRGVVYSNVAKGRSLVRYAGKYRRGQRATRRLLAGRPHVVVRYEDLASDPERELERVMRELGFELEPQQLDWRGGERHSVGGNLMRFETDTEIQVDESWRGGLSRWQQWLVRALTLGAQGH